MGAKELDDFFSRMGVMGFYPIGIWCITLLAWICKSFMFLGNALVSYQVDFQCDLPNSSTFMNGTFGIANG